MPETATPSSPRHIAPATGRLGVLTPGLGAVASTFIAGVVLYTYGTGPIKGFAITLSAGIICSMFTAIFVTRSVFMVFTDGKPRKSLSI